MLKLPSDASVGYLSLIYRKDEAYIKRNFIKLNIFFEALNYETIIQKKAYELSDLLGLFFVFEHTKTCI